ncbi:hypothetical protein Tco_0508109 [Tanacetum coccineum]
MDELVRLQICKELDDTWAWVALGPERRFDAAAGAPKVAEGALDVHEGAQAVPAPVQAPQPPPTAQGRTIPQRLARFTTWTVTSLSLMMDQSGVRYTGYSNYQIPYQRYTRRRTDDANTSAPQQPDP